MNEEKIASGAELHPTLDGVTYKYGTAGFRTKADVLDPVLFRVGLLAALRSLHQNGKAIGVMVTASHNPEEDNGAKIIDPMGDMMDQTWEGPATQLANTNNSSLVAKLKELVEMFSISFDAKPVVIIGKDTRNSSESLAKACMDGCSALGATCLDLGVVTTPQAHFVVRCTNDASYGVPTVEGYHDKLSNAFKTIFKLSGASTPIELTVDCANGVGAPQFAVLLSKLKNELNVRKILCECVYVCECRMGFVFGIIKEKMTGFSRE
eukprot:m.142629 g.142629  ORF g.142629 m.142629 type:complete len:265 (+) comp13196_c2_seq12:107-901(+)